MSEEEILEKALALIEQEYGKDYIYHESDRSHPAVPVGRIEYLGSGTGKRGYVC